MIGLIVITAGISSDLLQARKRSAAKQKLDAERLRVVQMTMTSVSDIVNNCLNQMMILRLDAEEFVPPETIAVFDEAVREATTNVARLGSIEKFAETPMEIGVGLDLTSVRNQIEVSSGIS